ncbi:hypothetical protein P7K49_032856 [Saguinus oedipus]|uniref:Uncharacterized protein n=1 Tax=Saguinus oedipus TaxID=9490 RepID=A0ABQ9TQL9_SAGOE|nr:hypothetical protein P7K49_032856 [Saguinus oedipus]
MTMITCGNRWDGLPSSLQYHSDKFRRHESPPGDTHFHISSRKLQETTIVTIAIPSQRILQCEKGDGGTRTVLCQKRHPLARGTLRDLGFSAMRSSGPGELHPIRAGAGAVSHRPLQRCHPCCGASSRRPGRLCLWPTPTLPSLLRRQLMAAWEALSLAHRLGGISGYRLDGFVTGLISLWRTFKCFLVKGHETHNRDECAEPSKQRPARPRRHLRLHTQKPVLRASQHEKPPPGTVREGRESAFFFDRCTPRTQKGPGAGRHTPRPL